MKPPEAVHVGPFTYSVGLEQMDDAAGKCDARYLTIRLDPDYAPANMRETLVHELLHACHQAAGMPDEMAKVRVETFVTHVAPFLLDALRRSPGLVDYLLAGAHCPTLDGGRR